MHRIGKAVAGMVARRNFEDAPVTVEVAAQDAKTGAAARHAERSGDIGTGRNRLNILRHARHLDTGKLFDLTEYRLARIGADVINDSGNLVMQIGIGQRDGIAPVCRSPQAPKAQPAPARDHAQLFGDRTRQATVGQSLEGKAAVAGILQDFGDVRQWLVQRPAPRRCGLNDGARPALALDQPLRAECPQRFAHRKARHAEARAQRVFGRKAIGKRATRDFAAQLVGKFEVAGLALRSVGQSSPPRSFTS